VKPLAAILARSIVSPGAALNLQNTAAAGKADVAANLAADGQLHHAAIEHPADIDAARQDDLFAPSIDGRADRDTAPHRIHSLAAADGRAGYCRAGTGDYPAAVQQNDARRHRDATVVDLQLAAGLECRPYRNAARTDNFEAAALNDRPDCDAAR
jgi:hypothetical protein